MSGNPLSDAIQYLVQVVFGLYILAVMLRFLFQLVRADFYNPISQAIVRVTNFPLMHLRRVIPGLWGIDLASVTLLLGLQLLELVLLGLLNSGHVPQLAGLIVWSVARLLKLATWVFIVTIFVRIILSWINPMGGYNPVVGLLISLTEPIMAPARRVIPPISGLDLSPIAVFVVLNLFLIVLVRPLEAFGIALAF